ncbi:MAG: hypothetical protein RL404_1106 [Pseudomonadota bacterium]
MTDTAMNIFVPHRPARRRKPQTPLLAVSLPALVLAAALPATAAAEGLRAAGGGGLYYSTDSEGFSSRRWSIDGMARYQHLDDKLGVRYTNYEFSKPGWSRSGQQLRLVANQFDRKTLEGWSVESGMFQAASKDLFTLDATWRKALAPGRSYELFLNRDFVETATAIDNGVSYDFAGAAIDYQWAPKWTTVGLAGVQNFSDGNQRRHLRGRLIYQPSLDIGLTTQLRYRWYDSSKTDVGGAYFNPSRYDEIMLAVGWRQRINNWRTAVTAGVGQQRIDAGSATTTRLAEASAERQMDGYALRLRAGYTHAASLAASDPNYWYRFAAIDLLIPF